MNDQPTFNDSQKTPWDRSDWIILTLFWIVPFIIFRNYLRTDTAIGGGDTLINLPYRILAARRILSGDLPFWSPDILGGADIWSYPACNVVFPVMYLSALIPPLLFINILTIASFSLGMTGTFLFARLWGLERIGSFAAALSYSFSGFFFSYFGAITNAIGMAAFYAPLLLASFLYLQQKPSASRAALASLAVFGMGAIGQEQIFMYGLLMAAFITLYSLIYSDNRSRKRIVFWSLLPAVLGILSLSVRFIPTYMSIYDSIRNEVFVELAYKDVFAFTLPPLRILAGLFKLNPKIIVPQNGYFGYFALFFFVIGLKNISRSRRDRWIFFGVIFVVVELYWNYIIPISALQGIPVLGWFHSPSRHMFEIFLWMSILSGRGVDSVIREKGISVRILVLALVFIIAAKTASLYYVHVNKSYIMHEIYFNKYPMLLTTIMFVTFIGITKRFPMSIKKISIFVAICIVAIINIYFFKTYADRIINRNGTADMSAYPEVLSFLDNQRCPGGTRGRFVFVGDIYSLDIKSTIECVCPNYSLIYNFPCIQAKNELLPDRYVRFVGKNNRVGFFLTTDVYTKYSSALDLLNTDYMLLPKQPPRPLNKPWKRRKSEIFEGIFEVKTPCLSDGQHLLFKWRSSGKGKQIKVVCNLNVPSIKPDIPVMKIDINNDKDFHRSSTFYSIKDIVPYGLNGNASLNNTIITDQYTTKRSLWSEISIDIPPDSSMMTIDITAVINKHLLTVLYVGIIDKDGNVIHEFRPMDNFIENQLQCELIFSNEYLSLYKRPNSFPRQWLTKRIAILPPAGILKELGKASLNPEILPRLRNVALVEDSSLKEFSSLLASEHAGTEPSITRTVDLPNHIAASVKTGSPVFAVFSEAWRPGWKATLDGKQVKIYRADYFLRGIPVPAGEHTIDMRYVTPGFFPGLAISLISFLVILMLAAIGRRQILNMEMNEEARHGV